MPRSSNPWLPKPLPKPEFPRKLRVRAVEGPRPPQATRTVEPPSLVRLASADLGGGSTGERRVLETLEELGIPFDFKPEPEPRPELGGIPASFLVPNGVIHVAEKHYSPLERASLEARGLTVLELLEHEVANRDRGDWRDLL